MTTSNGSFMAVFLSACGNAGGGRRASPAYCARYSQPRRTSRFPASTAERQYVPVEPERTGGAMRQENMIFLPERHPETQMPLSLRFIHSRIPAQTAIRLGVRCDRAF
ncbi:MAG: hypothetical protein HS110_12150 [Zoogloeaceae bacterium]|nr:hypothetical protein [Zoogloeaceae bacterium]